MAPVVAVSEIPQWPEHIFANTLPFNGELFSFAGIMLSACKTKTHLKV